MLRLVGGGRPESDTADDRATVRGGHRADQLVDRVLRRAHRELVRPVEPAHLDGRQVRRRVEAGDAAHQDRRVVGEPVVLEAARRTTARRTATPRARRELLPPGALRPAATTATGSAGPGRGTVGHSTDQLPAISWTEFRCTGSVSEPMPVAKNRSRWPCQAEPLARRGRR